MGKRKKKKKRQKQNEPLTQINYRFTRVDYLAGLMVFLISFIVYLNTLAPTVTADDSGELIAAGYALGIAHPPGYPLWTLLAKIFTFIPVKDIGYRVNLMSAFFASLTVATVYFLIPLMISTTSSLNRFIRIFAPVAGSLVFAFSSTFWSQSVITEVYTLNAFFVAVTLFLLFFWNQRRQEKYLYLLAFFYGLSLCNHHGMLLLSPVYLYYIIHSDITILRKPKVWGRVVILFLAALLFYFYLPLRSLADPPVDWGNPETLRNFFDHVTRRQYGSLNKYPRTLSLFLKQIWSYLRSLWGQFTPYVGCLGFLGFRVMHKDNKKVFRVTLSVFLLNSLMLIYLLNFSPERETLNSVEVFYIPAYLIVSLWIGSGLLHLGKIITGKLKQPGYLLVIFLLIPLLPLLSNYHKNDRSRDYVAYNYALNVFKTLLPEAIVFTSSDYQIFPLTYLQVVEGRREDVTICDKNADLEKAILGEGYNESRLVHPQVTDMRLLDILNANLRPVYYLIKRDMETLPGYRLKPVGLTYEVCRIGEERRDDNDYWKRYGLSDIERDYYDYTTNLVVAAYRFFRGEGYFEAGDKETAILEFKETSLIAEKIQAKEIFNNLGSALAEKGYYNLAIEEYRKALNLDSRYVMVYNNLGSIYKDEGRKEEAKRAFIESLKINPQQPRVRQKLVQLLES